MKNTIPDDKCNVVMDDLKQSIFTYHQHPKIQFTYEMERNNTICFLYLEIIKADNSKLIINWCRKITYTDGLLNFISTHPFQHTVSTIKKLVDRVVDLLHESFHWEI